MKKKIAGALITVAMSMGIIVTVDALPAGAGTTPCEVYAGNPWTTGVTSYSSSRIECGAVLTGRIESQHQEHYLSWRTRATANKWGEYSSMAVMASYDCNGHGTDNYRTRAYGKDKHDNNKTIYSATRSLTC